MKKSIKLLLLTLLLLSATGLGGRLCAQERPRLVIGIVVDQMQTDQLEFLLPLMSQGGFNRLLKNGLYITDLDFGVPRTDAVSATAQLYTGAWPSHNGVTADKTFDRRTRRLVPTLLTKQGYSPEQLRLSTITDEVVVDGQKFGQVYSIAADPQTAVLLGGHTPTAASWIDPNTGQWATSSYYSSTLTAPLAARNLRTPLRARLDTMRWQPLLDIKQYPGLPPQKKYYPFSHTFRVSDRDVYTRFAISPLGNREITDVAISYLTDLKPGQGKGNIDMLNIGYSLAPFTTTRDGDYRLELTDSYLRLDRDLERLLNSVDAQIGLDNTLIFLLSTGHFDNDTKSAEKYRIPGGEMSTKRAAALLNSFMSAKYGHADYVDGIAGTFVYLNEKAMTAAETKRLPGECTPLQQARDFLVRMDGIASVSTVSDILGGTTQTLEEARHALDADNCGDLVMEIQPGWVLVDDFTLPATHTAIRRCVAATPAIIMAPGITTPAVIKEPVSALRIAPTISRLLRIQAPNGSAARSLPLK